MSDSEIPQQSKCRLAALVRCQPLRASFVTLITKSKFPRLVRVVARWGLVFLCATSVANALDPNRKISQYGHTAWRIEDGAVAPGGSIAQTTDGYLWLGTSGSLMRFDGVRFTRWQLPEGQRLPGRSVTYLLGTHDGSLWIGTTGGLSRLKDGQLKVYADSAKPTGISAIIEDHSGTVWATRYKLGARDAPLCSVAGEALRCFGKKDGIPVPFGLGLAADAEGNLWFGSKVLCRWRPGTAATTYFAGISDKLPLGEGVIDVAVAPSGATAWASLDGTGPKLGVRYFSAGKWMSYVVPGFDGTRVWSHTLLLDRNGSLWVGTENEGIYRIHDGVADHYTMSDGLSGNSVGLFFEDREGNMWVLTEGGLDMFRNTAIISYTIHQGLSSANLRSVLALRDGSVWLANGDGVDVLRKESESTSFFSRALPGYSVKAMLEDHNGAIWLAVDHTLMRFQNGRFREIRRQDTEPFAGNGEVTGIAEGENRRIWILTSEGRLFSAVGDTIEEHALPNNASGSRKFLAAAKSGLWIGSNTGSISYYREGQLQSVTLADSQGPIDIYGLFVDADDSVLVSTLRGLYRWKDGQLSVLTRENGLPCDAVYSVIRDDHNALWIFSQCGIVKIDTTELAKWVERPHSRVAVTTFDALDGAHAGLGILYQPTSSKAPDGRLWFAGGVMVQVLDPDHLHKNTVPPPISVEGVVADHKILKLGPSLQIPALTRDLEVDYTALSFSVPQKVRFRYKLEGRDREWQDAGTRRQAFYTDLAPGKYRFRAIACNNDGVWNETGASLSFSVLPALYQTAWLRALGAVAFLALLWVAYQLRVRQLRQQQKKLQDVIETMPTFAWTALPDGSVDFVNRHFQEYTGLSTAQIAGSGWKAAVHPQDLQRNVEKWCASMTSGEPFESELRYRRAADGQYRWFLSRAVPLRDARGKIVKWYGTSTDIEDRKRAEQLQTELAHINRVTTMGELTASLAHEIKQPIAATVMNAQASLRWLKHDQPDLREASNAMTRIVEDGKRAGEIIQRIRSLYTKSQPQRELVEVNEIIREMVVLLRSEAYRHPISVRTQLAANLPTITADRVQLQQVLMNLMLNGIEAMKDTGGVLTIKSQLDQDGRLLISVCDTGVGLPAEKTDQIFDAFFTTKPQGSGMGLAISRSILESHGGRLWATANDGQGATFHFTVPIAADASSVPTPRM